MKTFTLQEARALLPVLRSLLQRAIDGKQKAEGAEQYLVALSQRIQLSGGMQVDVRAAAQQRALQQHGIAQANDAVQEIDAIDVQVKDLDTGLLDFPFQLGSDVVLLCWKLGEDDIDFWHSTDDGFRGRQPLDERFYGRMGHSPRSGEGSKPN